MRLPSDMGRVRRSDIVSDTLDMLGMRHVQHNRVGSVERRGISGGQRKRVNIGGALWHVHTMRRSSWAWPCTVSMKPCFPPSASSMATNRCVRAWSSQLLLLLLLPAPGMELVSMPSVLFLDEPTSGLDATSSHDILSSLGDMAALGMNVILVLHQPRFASFMLFDQVRWGWEKAPHNRHAGAGNVVVNYSGVAGTTPVPAGLCTCPAQGMARRDMQLGFGIHLTGGLRRSRAHAGASPGQRWPYGLFRLPRVRGAVLQPVPALQVPQP